MFLAGCKKKEELTAPVISFKPGDAYTKDGAVVMVGHKLYFGIHATATNTVITNFTIKKKLDDGTETTVLDSGLYSSELDVSRIVFQNVEPKVTWTFSVLDRNRLSAEISIVVYKDPNSVYGGIIYFPSVKLGYQNNTAFGHFATSATGNVYFEDTATAKCGQVDFLTYFITSNGQPSPVLSSAGEMDNGSTEAQLYYPCINNWTIRNYTLWDISVDTDPIPAAAFDAAQNDSLLIASYHDVWGKKKFRWATSGKVIPFLTTGGKKGLVKVISADLTDTGIIEIAVKIQQ